MVYKYQLETIEEIKKALGSIEEMTENRYEIKIGYRKVFLDNGLNTFTNEIYACVNHNSYFEEDDELYDVRVGCEIEYETDVYFDEDIFLKLNKLIDKIIEDNREREEFHEKLNQELKALNKSL